MEIAGVSAAMHTIDQAGLTSAAGQVGLKMLDMSLSSGQQMGAEMVKMMEQSVTPYLGSNFDMSV